MVDDGKTLFVQKLMFGMKSSTPFIWPKIGHLLFLLGGVSGLIMAGFQMTNQPAVINTVQVVDTLSRQAPVMADPMAFQSTVR